MWCWAITSRWTQTRKVASAAEPAATPVLPLKHFILSPVLSIWLYNKGTPKLPLQSFPLRQRVSDRGEEQSLTLRLGNNTEILLKGKSLIIKTEDVLKKKKQQTKQNKNKQPQTNKPRMQQFLALWVGEGPESHLFEGLKITSYNCTPDFFPCLFHMPNPVFGIPLVPLQVLMASLIT